MDYDYREALKLSNQFCFPLYAAARKITSLYTPYLAPLHLTYTQYLVFLVLWEQDGVPVSEICRKLKLDNGTLSPLLKKMEKLGYLTRTRSTEDERIVLIKLTDLGWDMQKQAAEIPLKVGSCVKLSPEKANLLYETLYEILEAPDKA